MSISIEWKEPVGIQHLQTDLSNTMQLVFVETADEVIASAREIAKAHVRSEVRKPNSRSGRYLNSIHSTTLKTPFQVFGQVASAHPQAAILEFGSRPHVIEAKNRNALFWPGAAFPLKKINHPGTPAFRVLGSAVEEALKNTEIILNQVINKHWK